MGLSISPRGILLAMSACERGHGGQVTIGVRRSAFSFRRDGRATRCWSRRSLRYGPRSNTRVRVTIGPLAALATTAAGLVNLRAGCRAGDYGSMAAEHARDRECLGPVASSAPRRVAASRISSRRPSRPVRARAAEHRPSGWALRQAPSAPVRARVRRGRIAAIALLRATSCARRCRWSSLGLGHSPPDGRVCTTWDDDRAGGTFDSRRSPRSGTTLIVCGARPCKA